MNAVVRLIAVKLVMAALLVSTLMFSSTADATTAYVAKRTVTTSQGDIIPAGVTVEVLGINEVANRLAPSGQLITFTLRGKIFTADATDFELQPDQAPFIISGWVFQASAAQARLCTNFIRREAKQLLWTEQSNLQSYVRVTSNGKTVSFSVNSPAEPPENRPRQYYDYLNESAQLCIERLDYNTDYQIELLPGLQLSSCKGANCHQLTLEQAVKSFASTEKRPAEIILQQGKTILPMSQQALVPVTVTHVDTLQINLFKVDLRSVTNAYDLFQNLSSYDAEYFAEGVGLKVASFALKVNAGDQQEQALNLDLNKYLPAHEEGLFVALFDSPELKQERWQQRPTQWLLRSNVGLTSFHGQQFVDVWLGSFDLAREHADAHVQVLAKNNRLLFDGRSDKQGRVRIERALLNGNGEHAPAFLMVQTADQGVALMSFSASGNRISSNQRGRVSDAQGDIYLTSDRDLYRGGDRIEWLLLARDNQLNAQPQRDLQIRLVNPQREVVHNSTITTDTSGAAAAHISLAAQAQLGDYELQVLSMDSQIVARQSIEVDDFVPLTIAARIDGPKQLGLHQPLELSVSADYLSGGAAAGLNAELKLALSGSNNHEDARWKGFVFGQPTNSYTYLDQRSGILDADGRFITTFTIDPDAIEKTALYSLGVDGSVFDASGRANDARGRIMLDSHSSYLGVRAQTSGDSANFDDGQAVKFSLQRIDRQGKELALQQVNYELRHVQYSYDWFYQNSDGWRYRLKRQTDQLIEQGDTEQASLSFSTPLSWGWYELTVTSHDGFKTVLPFRVGWGSGVAMNEPEVLPLQVNEVDGLLILQLQAPFAGRLKVLQAGSDIEAVQDFEVKAGANRIQLRKQSASEPGFHVLANLIRPISRGSEHLPQLALGSSWVSQLKPQRNITTSISTAERLNSTDPIEVDVQFSSVQGKAKIFLVDEGIHAINGYQNANSQQFFFGARRFSLGFLSNYGQLLQQDDSLKTIAVGGDRIMVTGSAMASPPEEKMLIQKSDFFDTVTAASPLLDIVDGRIRYRFEPAAMEGRFRLVVISASEQGVGFAEAQLQVRDPVSVGLSLPRFLSPSDSVLSKLVLRFQSDQDDLVLQQQVGEISNQQQISGNSGSLQARDWLLSSDQVGHFPVSVSLQNQTLNINRDYNLIVRDSSYVMTQLQSFPVSRSAQVAGVDFSDYAKAEQVRMNWSISPIAGASLKQAVAGLQRYPYGCLEQTSSGLRGLLALIAVQGMTAERQMQLRQGIQNLADKQHSSGGFGYWSRNAGVDELYTLYAVDTLLQSLRYLDEPQQARTVVDKALAYIDQKFYDNAWLAMYANGILLQQGFEVTSRARYALDELLPRALVPLRQEPSNEQPWQLRYRHADERDLLIAGYWLASLLKDQTRLTKVDQQLAALYNQQNSWSKRFSDWLNSDQQSPEPLARSRSAMLLAAIAPEQQSNTVQKLQQQLTQGLAQMRYRSTWDNAGLAALLQRYAELTPQSVQLKINGQALTDWQQLSISQAQQGFLVGHNSNQPLYLSVELEGLRSGSDAQQQGFTVQKQWFDLNGQLLSDNSEAWQVQQGSLLTVMLTLTSHEAIRAERSMLTDLLPAGFELVDNDADPWVGDGKGQIVKASGFTIKPGQIERMDDRYSAALPENWSPQQPMRVVYQVRASFAGSMQVPDAHVELMYRPEVHGRSARTEVTVVPR